MCAYVFFPPGIESFYFETPAFSVFFVIFFRKLLRSILSSGRETRDKIYSIRVRSRGFFFFQALLVVVYRIFNCSRSVVSLNDVARIIFVMREIPHDSDVPDSTIIASVCRRRAHSTRTSTHTLCVKYTKKEKRFNRDFSADPWPRVPPRPVVVILRSPYIPSEWTSLRHGMYNEKTHR